MIDVRAISFRYRETWVLRDVSFQIARGEFVGIIGPNGSGKTTLLKILSHLLSPQEGEVLLGQVPLGGLKRSEVARKMAVVPQETHLLFPFKAMEIVLMGRSPYLGHRLFEGQKDLEVVERAMAWTGTLPLSERAMDELSGGERKRVTIARALAQEPEIILLDEPTANLDIHHQLDFLNLLLTLNQEQGMTILMATHDMNLAAEFCGRLILLKEGRLHKSGTPGEVITKEEIEGVYGCEVWVDQNPVSGMPRIGLLRRRADESEGGA